MFKSSWKPAGSRSLELMNHSVQLNFNRTNLLLYIGKKTKDDNPVNPNKPHNFLSLQEAGTQIKAQFANICKEVAGKITEMCKAEKDAWHKLDQLEDECETMYKQVETKTEVLVSGD